MSLLVLGRIGFLTKHRSRVAAILMLAACLAPASAAAAASNGEVVVAPVVGEPQNRAGLRSANGEEVEFTEGEAIRTDDLESITFRRQGPTLRTEAGCIVHLRGGGRLRVTEAVLVDDACQVTFVDGRTAKLSLEDVSGLQWLPDAGSVWESALARPSEEHDFVILRAEPQPTTLRAFVETVSAEFVEFDWNRETRKVNRSQVAGIVFARLEAVPDDRKFVVTTSEGSTIPASGLQSEENGAVLRCSVSDHSVISLPASTVEDVRIRSSRIVDLSSLKPVEVSEKPLVAYPRSWQSGANVLGQPLTAGGRVFRHGLGVQSGTSLTFEIDRPGEQFVSLLSVEEGQGDCEFIVSAEGAELVRKRVRGDGVAIDLKVPLNGARRLELRVDYGENLDLGDTANWCNPRVIVAAPQPDRPSEE